MTTAAVHDRLVQRLVALCAVQSVTGHERDLADKLEKLYASEPLVRVGDSLVVGQPDDRPLVLLVGHIDVVPPTDLDREPRLEQHDGGDVVVGRGASDMKSGVAVAQELFEDESIRTASHYNLALVLYSGEEGPAHENQLGEVLDAVPWLKEAALAIILEPTDLEVQAGCLGSIHAELAFTGRAAHSARPWFGANALTRAGQFLTKLADTSPLEADVQGIIYHDVWSATQAWTNNAKNVIPELFTINLNYRFAPDRTMEQAEAELEAFVADRAEIDIVDRASPAPPHLDDPTVLAFVDSLNTPVTGKQAWTDIARFSAIGVPGVNFGPGLTAQAHHSGEYVPVDNLVKALESLRRFLVE